MKVSSKYLTSKTLSKAMKDWYYVPLRIYDITFAAEVTFVEFFYVSGGDMWTDHCDDCQLCEGLLELLLFSAQQSYLSDSLFIVYCLKAILYIIFY